MLMLLGSLRHAGPHRRDGLSALCCVAFIGDGYLLAHHQWLQLLGTRDCLYLGAISQITFAHLRYFACSLLVLQSAPNLHLHLHLHIYCAPLLFSNISNIIMKLLHLSRLIILSLGVADVLASHVVHERRNSNRLTWRKRSRMDPVSQLPIRIALTQQNLHLAEDHLMNVSDPSSLHFSKHWTPAQVAQKFAPSRETVHSIVTWLNQSGIAMHRLHRSHCGGWLSFNASVHEAEQLLRTRYHLYERRTTGDLHAGCEEYSIPAWIRQHVDFITPTIHFDEHNKLKRGTSNLSEGKPGHHKSIEHPDEVLGKHRGSNKQLTTAPTKCDQFTTLDCLRALYNIPTSNHSHPSNSLGIVEFSPVSYLPEDLDIFFSNFTPYLTGQRPQLEAIDGGALQSELQGFAFNGEADLDFEYTMALTYPLNVTNYQVGDMLTIPTMNNFLAALDGTYCGALDPSFDAVYPDLTPGGYNTSDCGTVTPAKVISVSYSHDEIDFSPAYERRQCLEYLKLGLQGVSMIFSSADFGVAGQENTCLDPATGQANLTTGGRFNPTFPSTCPYVTSVGGTQLPPNGSVTDREVALKQQLGSQLISSGGGFSNVFEVPGYQSRAVQSYLTSQAAHLSNMTILSNSTGFSRGYPDVAANAANYMTSVDGAFTKVYGTSASAPVFAAVVAKINDARLKAGKGTVGFINPLLYANPGVLNDVVEGSNYGCGSEAFRATEGWDPVTGLGTPDFQKLRDLYLGLP